jgi:hypothetical protein
MTATYFDEAAKAEIGVRTAPPIARTPIVTTAVNPRTVTSTETAVPL